ncbi:MAG: class I SAM-dependent methyltransferase [Bacteroidales bacterium]|nr:class I SAM-dependent methyltransferase [Bacteroidales bacterium]
MENLGQKKELWSTQWNKLSPKSEIQMWDFYGLRPWILKYTPRFGKVIEAGCGLGRYNFYFSRMGINIEGIDFSESTVKYLNNWKVKNGFDTNFIVGDVTKLPYKDNSISGYLSFGVIEHFIEGPQKALKEAYRVLQPGGVAIISTPSVSWIVFINNIKRKIKNLIKRIIGRKINKPPFFQYEYKPYKLKRFVEQAGFKVVKYSGADLLYTFCEIGNFIGKNLKKGGFAYWFSNLFENTWLKTFGAQSIVIAVKEDKEMFCFLSGEKKANLDSLKKFDIPVNENLYNNELSGYYLKNIWPKFHNKYIINPPVKTHRKETCEFSGEEYLTDPVFEDYGFSKKVSPNSLKKFNINIELSNKYIQPIWRKRK